MGSKSAANSCSIRSGGFEIFTRVDDGIRVNFKGVDSFGAKKGCCYGEYSGARADINDDLVLNKGF